MMDEISIVDVQTQKVIGIRKKGKYELISQLLPQLFEFAASQGAEFTGPPVFVCHEITVGEVMKAQQQGTADIELAIPIANDIEETDEIKCYTLQGGKMAKIIHKGPYEQCQPAYEKLYKWLEQNGWKITGPIREVYLNTLQVRNP